MRSSRSAVSRAGSSPLACTALEVARRGTRLARALLDAAVARRPATRRRVRERPQHPRDVAQRRALPPPFGQRPRRLALEVDHEPVAARPEHLAEVQVAVVADPLADGADCVERAEQVAHGVAAAGDRRDGLVVGQVAEGLVDLLVDVAVRSASDSGLASSGAKGVVGNRSPAPRASRRRPVRAGRTRADELAPRRRQLLERERPAVDGARHELLHDPERRAEQRAASRPPADSCGTFSKPCATRKRSSSSSGFTPASMRR